MCIRDRIIPEHQTNLLALGILSQFLNLVTTDALVPPVVYEDSLCLLYTSIETNTVYAALIGDSGCHLEDITCIALMAALVIS